MFIFLWLFYFSLIVQPSYGANLTVSTFTPNPLYYPYKEKLKTLYAYSIKKEKELEKTLKEAIHGKGSRFLQHIIAVYNNNNSLNPQITGDTKPVSFNRLKKNLHLIATQYTALYRLPDDMKKVLFSSLYADMGDNFKYNMVYNLKNERPINWLNHHNYISHMALSSSENLLAIARYNYQNNTNYLNIWDLTTYTSTKNKKLHCIKNVTFFNKNNLAVHHNYHQLSVYEIKNRKTIFKDIQNFFPHHITSLGAFEDDRVLVATRNGVYLYQNKSIRLISPLIGIDEIKVSPNQKIMALKNFNDNSIYLHNISGWEYIKRIILIPYDSGFYFSNNNTLILNSSYEIKWIDIKTQKCLLKREEEKALHICPSTNKIVTYKEICLFETCWCIKNLNTNASELEISARAPVNTVILTPNLFINNVYQDTATLYKVAFSKDELEKKNGEELSFLALLQKKAEFYHPRKTIMPLITYFLLAWLLLPVCD